MISESHGPTIIIGDVKKNKIKKNNDQISLIQINLLFSVFFFNYFKCFLTFNYNSIPCVMVKKQTIYPM